MKYAISEEFHSLQGEGLYTGTPMKFVRLAYCDVNCPWCDTDYSVRYTKYASEILEDLAEDHLCITGGEPLQQSLQDLIYRTWKREKVVHIETSGTVEIPDWIRSGAQLGAPGAWITLSPKKGFLEENIRKADEIKLVVAPLGIDRNLDEQWEYFKDRSMLCYKYLQPLNNVGTLNDESIRYTLDLLYHYPQWRLSIQLQKVLGVR